jgi:two-component system chemotaxis response regulator CheB
MPPAVRGESAELAMDRAKAIVVGCSAGGLSALQAVLGGLAPALAVPVVVCCHTGSSDVGMLCDLLQRHCALPVLEAIERVMPAAGHVYVAPSGYHLLVERDGRFALSADAKVGFSRPSIDVLFASASEAWGAALVGVILTGANQDGAQGLRLVRAAGGIGVVQAPGDAEVPVMPQAAIDTAGADYIVPLAAIATLLNRSGSIAL